VTALQKGRRAWREMGRAGFLSTPVIVVFLVWTVAVVLYLEVVVADEPAVPWLVASAAASLIVAAALVVLRILVPRRWPDGPGPVLALVTYIAAGALRGVLLVTVSDLLDLTTPVNAAARIVQSALWAAGLMAVTSIIVTRSRTHRQVMTHLAERQDELLHLQSGLTERIEQTHRELGERVRDELAPTLANLRSRLDALPTSTQEDVADAVAGFRAAISDVVRPLSRTLVEAAPTLVPTDPARPATLRKLWSTRISLATAIQPGASAVLLLALLALTAAALAPEDYRDATSFVRVVLLAGALWLTLHAWKGLARRLRWHPTLAATTVLMPAIIVVSAVADGLAVRALTSGLGAPATTAPAVAVVPSIIVPLLVSTAVILQELANAAEQQRSETVGQLETLTAVLRRELWRERRRLALTVHGPIQSALVAAAVTLSRPGFTPDQVPALAATLDQAMAHIDRSTGPIPPLVASARDLATLWVDRARVTFSMDDDAIVIIDSNEALRAAVVETMREGVSNAIRHGAADTIDVTVRWSATGTLDVVIDDDGDGPPSSSEPGLGSMMLDEISLQWSLAHGGLGTRLCVEFAADRAKDAEPRPMP